MAEGVFGKTVKSILSKLTSWNMQAGKGVIPSKQGFRYPSPGSQPVQPTKGVAAIKLPMKEEDIADQKYEERRMRLLVHAFSQPVRGPIPDDPSIDPRNFFGATFQGLPAFPPVRVYKMKEMVYDRDGYRVPLADVQRGISAKEKKAEN